jgi:hypothetical protein
LSGVIELPAIRCRLEMARVYRRVPLAESPAVPATGDAI